VLHSSLIVPGTTYHFLIKGTDQAGNKATSADNVFATKGATLVITIVDKDNNRPLKGALVSHDDQTVTTDQQGQATLKDLPYGKSTVTITVNGKKTTETVQISQNATADAPQKVFFKVPSQSAGLSWAMIVSIVIVLMVAAISFAGFKLHWTRRFLHLSSLPWNKKADMASMMPPQGTSSLPGTPFSQTAGQPYPQQHPNPNPTPNQPEDHNGTPPTVPPAA
jgi:hypothetical protein